MSARVFVACNFPSQVLEPFLTQFDTTYNDTGRVLTTDELIAGAQGVEALVVTATDRLDAGVVARLPESIRVVGTYSVGQEHLDVEALGARGIAVFSTPDVLDDSCADVAMLLMLGAARRALEGIELLRSGQWTGWSPRQQIGHDVWGRRLGILGMGRIGRAIAQRARGFGMTIHYHNRNRLDPQLELGAQYHATAHGMAAQSDFLCVACPSTPATRRMVNADLIAHLPPQAIVCNIARGDIICDESLVQALESGHVAAAGLDVFDGEPNVHPAYRALPNVFALPHIGSSTWGTRLAMADRVCQNLKWFFEGQTSEDRLI